VRAVFTLMHVLGMSLESAAAACGTTKTAVRVADIRGRQDLANYLGPRCEHMDADNPCHCADRLGNALEDGLVRWPDYDDYGGAPFVPELQRDVGELYTALPRVRLPVLQ